MKREAFLMCLATGSLASVAAAKDLGQFPTADPNFIVQLQTEAEGGRDPGIELNSMTTLLVKLRLKDGVDASKLAAVIGLEFDARMPEHNHGMVVKPQITAIAPGEYRVAGVKLHMAGAWMFYLSIQMAGSGTAGTIKLQLPYTM